MADWNKMSDEEKLGYCDEMVNHWAGLKYELELGLMANTDEEKAAIASKVSGKMEKISSVQKDVSMVVEKEIGK